MRGNQGNQGKKGNRGSGCRFSLFPRSPQSPRGFTPYHGSPALEGGLRSNSLERSGEEGESPKGDFPKPPARFGVPGRARVLLARGTGFTLIEVLATMMVFTVSMVSLVAVYLGTARLAESSRNLTTAMNDARTAVEAIRDDVENPALGLAAVAARTTDAQWAAWEIANNLNLTSLPGEGLTVLVWDPAADPLQLTISITWQERGQNKTALIETMVTDR